MKGGGEMKKLQSQASQASQADPGFSSSCPTERSMTTQVLYMMEPFRVDLQSGFTKHKLRARTQMLCPSWNGMLPACS